MSGRNGATPFLKGWQRIAWNSTRWRRMAAAWLSLLLTLPPSPTPLWAAWDAGVMLAAGRQAGGQGVAGVMALQSVLNTAKTLDDPGKLQLINDFFNRRIQFRDDREIWGQTDYWASPVETLSRGAGDCEDYAIAKYFTLLAAGMPTARLRLVYVRAQVGGPQGVVQAHMVLAYYAGPDTEPVILDNLLSELRPASRRPDLMPVFSFNSEGLWQGVAGAASGDSASRLSRWREVLAKARAEGFQ